MPRLLTHRHWEVTNVLSLRRLQLLGRCVYSCILKIDFTVLVDECLVFNDKGICEKLDLLLQQWRLE